MNTERIFAWITFIILLILLVGGIADSFYTSTNEADISISIVEQYDTAELDRVAAHCSVPFNDAFLDAANTIRLLRSPTSIAEAKTQLELLNRLVRVEVNQINSICDNGRRAAFLARVEITVQVSYFFKHHSDVSIDDELQLLNLIPSKQIAFVDTIKKRLQKMGCDVQQVDFAYHCAIN